jgi:hypothetical protein
VEGSTPSQGPDANGFVTGRFGRQSLEHQRRQFEVRHETLEEFSSPNRSLGYKIQIPALPDFNAGICLFLTPFLLALEEQAHWRRLHGDGSQIRPGVLSQKQGHGSTVRGFPADGIGK